MLKLTSPAFGAEGELPPRHTCLGPDLSPPIEWSGAPNRARTWALLCEDAGTGPAGAAWTHWAAYGIPAALRGLPEGVPAAGLIPGGGRQGLNGFGRLGWGGPCPAPGEERRLVFTLYAVSKDPEVPAEAAAPAAALLSSIHGWTIAKTSLAVRFRRPSVVSSKPRNLSPL